MVFDRRRCTGALPVGAALCRPGVVVVSIRAYISTSKQLGLSSHNPSC